MFKDDELHETHYCENCLELQQKLQEARNSYIKLDLLRVKEYNKLVDEYKAKKQECEALKATLQASDIAKAVISSAEVNFPIIEKLSNALDNIKELANEACNACKKFTPNRQSDISCRYCQPTQILDIINKAKESK